MRKISKQRKMSGIIQINIPKFIWGNYFKTHSFNGVC
jgi:hypothetical protein